MEYERAAGKRWSVQRVLDRVAAALQVSDRTVKRVGKNFDIDSLPDVLERETRKRNMQVPEAAGAVVRQTVYGLYAGKKIPTLDLILAELYQPRETAVGGGLVRRFIGL